MNRDLLTKMLHKRNTVEAEVTATVSVTQPIQWSSENRRRLVRGLDKHEVACPAGVRRRGKADEAAPNQYYDTDLGLVYYNYRHYNPTDGRWISRDPIAEQGGLNLYGFVGNSSIIGIDSLGTNVGKSENVCCCSGKKLRSNECCINNKKIAESNCTIQILMGHYNEEHLKKKIASLHSRDRIGIVSCFSTESNKLIPRHQYYLNKDRNTGLLYPGENADKYLKKELEEARREANKMCRDITKKCCSIVRISVLSAGNDDGDGEEQVKFSFRTFHYSETIYCNQPKPIDCQSRGGQIEIGKCKK